MARQPNLEFASLSNCRFKGGNKQDFFKMPDGTAFTLEEKMSGYVIMMPNLTATLTVTLPAPKRGLTFEFQYAGAAADAQNWVITSGSDTNYFVGGVVFLDLDTDVLAPVYADGNSNSKMTVVTPEVGTRIMFRCDGVLWYLNGNVASATVPTLADQ